MDQKTLPKMNKHEKSQQKWRKEKRRQPSRTPSFFSFFRPFYVFISHHDLHKKNGLLARRFDAPPALSSTLEF